MALGILLDSIGTTYQLAGDAPLTAAALERAVKEGTVGEGRGWERGRVALAACAASYTYPRNEHTILDI